MQIILRKSLLTILFSFLSIWGIAQNTVEDIRASIAIGNVNGIARYFDNNLSLNIAGSQASYSRPQAEMVLRDFFKKNTPRKLDIEHTDASRNLRYAMGTLITSTGNYRVYFVVKQKENNTVLQELRIER
jgi:hypothetical protein